MLYAVAINGSPRTGGNTELLLKETLAPLGEAGWRTELIQIGGQVFRGCTACGQCGKTKDMRCAIDSDPFNEIMAKLVEADAMIFGSPTYFADVTAEMKALLDRAGYVALHNGGAFAGKIGAAVVAVRRGGAIHVFDTINHMFQINRMILPGSTYWNMAYGLGKGEVADDQEGLRNMQHLGRTITWLGAAIQPHLDTFPKG